MMHTCSMICNYACMHSYITILNDLSQWWETVVFEIQIKTTSFVKIYQDNFINISNSKYKIGQ